MAGPAGNEIESPDLASCRAGDAVRPPRSNLERLPPLNRLIISALVRGFGLLLGSGFAAAAAPLPPLEPFVTLVDSRPAEGGAAKSPARELPGVIRPARGNGDTRAIDVPPNGGADIAAIDGASVGGGKAGTGFFVSTDGTLLTAAHVVRSCRRTQIISQYLARTWTSVVATDDDNDIAILRATDVRPPGVVHINGGSPASRRLFVLGFPSGGDLVTPVQTIAILQNDKLPSSVGALGNPREVLWLSAPAIGHGYSGGPIFDPGTGSVVGLVKGTVDGGYLRLIRNMPTIGVAIGPGAGQIGALLRQAAPFSAISLASASGESGFETLRRATVHVLCWQ